MLFAFRVEDYPEGTVLRDPTPIRLFRADWLEAISHVHPSQLVAVIAPLCAGLLLHGGAHWQRSWPLFWGLFGAGAGLVWTLLEYGIHRFLFHCRPRRRWQAELLFLFHGIHHVQPQVRTRLLMPLAVSLPLAAGFLKLFQLVLGDLHPPLAAGVLLGYLSYDLLHFTLHFNCPKSLRWLKRHHMKHHFVEPQRRFGVSTPMWDRVFGT